LADPFFTGVAPVCEVLQWHGVEVIKIPPGGTILAQSPACAVQALRVGKHAYGIQFHIEVTGTTVQEWRAVPGYRYALESALGAGAIDKIDADCAARRAGFQDAARRLFDNFIERVRNYRV
jgi:GMP synthase-like glutamine amidotransferase